MTRRRYGALGKALAAFALVAAALALGLGMAPNVAWAEDLTAPLHEKSISETADENGQYLLTLNVTGKSQSSTTSNPVDVIFVLDTSNSMNRRMNNEEEASSNTSRLYYAKNAVQTMANGLLTDGSNARVALITFDGNKDWPYGWAYDDAASLITGDWTTSSQQVSQSLNSVTTGTYGGGTNWEAGLYEAQQLLNSARTDADVYVVFVSDGNAGYYYDDQGYTQGTGTPGAGNINQTAYDHAVALANSLNAEIVSVGVGPQNNVNHLVNFAEAVSGPYYSGASESDLNKAVSSILDTITNSQTYRGVSIVDNLSEYVALPEGAVTDGIVTDARISVTNANGEDVTSAIPEAANWRLVQTSDGSLRIDFGENYELVDGYTYSVSFPVVPTQAAYDETYRRGDQNASTPEFDSDGLPTNSSARVEYSIVTDVNGVETVVPQQPVPYNVPEIAVPMSQVTVQKIWPEGATDLPESVTVNVYRDNETTPLATVTLSAEKSWTQTVTVAAGPTGHTYSISEVDPGQGWIVSGYTVNSQDGSSVQLKGLTAQTASFTVTNVPATYRLLVKKTDGDTGDALQNAKFDLVMAAADGTYDANGQKVAANVLVGADSIATFSNLTPGTYYLVETYVPAGYELRTEPYKIVVTTSGIQFAKSADDALENATQVEGQERTYQVSFANTKTVSEIPSTGGMGDLPIYAAGFVALASSAMALRKVRRS